MRPKQQIHRHGRAEWFVADVLAADEGPLREAMESVRWERRGWLGRLVRLERAPDELAARARHRVRRLRQLVA